MRNDGLEKALEETWKNKEKFYEDTKELSILEIIKEIEDKYKVSAIGELGGRARHLSPELR